MDKEILLVSEDFVKDVSNISDNVDGVYIIPAIREAQECKLQGILGSKLFDKLKEMVGDGQILRQPKYRTLLDKCQYFLAYSAIVELTFKLSYKIANMGVIRTRDENTDSATFDEIVQIQTLWQSKADHEAYLLQDFLIHNKADYPELTQGDCWRIKSNLKSAASCGIFLGGARGKGGWR